MNDAREIGARNQERQQMGDCQCSTVSRRRVLRSEDATPPNEDRDQGCQSGRRSSATCLAQRHDEAGTLRVQPAGGEVRIAPRSSPSAQKEPHYKTLDILLRAKTQFMIQGLITRDL